MSALAYLSIALKHSFSMLRLVEHGEMHRLRRLWNARKPECIQSAKRSIHVGIREFSCALAVFALGVLISFIVFVFEIVLHYKRFRFISVIKLMNKRRKAQSQNEVKVRQKNIGK